MLTAAAKAQAAAALVEWQLKQAQDHLAASAALWKAVVSSQSIKATVKVDALQVPKPALDDAPYKALGCLGPG